MYDQTRNWSYLFYPPPYNFLAPPSTFSKPGVVAPEDVLQPRGAGLGCAECGGTCGGLGQTSNGGLFGTGLFLSGDPSTWGWGEYLAVFLGGYFLVRFVGDIGSGASKAYRPIKRARARSRRRRQLQQELDQV